MDLLYNLEPTSWSRNFDEEEVDEVEFKEPDPIKFQVRTQACISHTRPLALIRHVSFSCLYSALTPFNDRQRMEKQIK